MVGGRRGGGGWWVMGGVPTLCAILIMVVYSAGAMPRKWQQLEPVGTADAGFLLQQS